MNAPLQPVYRPVGSAAENHTEFDFQLIRS